MTDPRSLATYLNDHLAMATAGIELLRRASGSHPGRRAEELTRLRDEARSDLESLRSLMRRLEVPESRPMAALGWLGEKAGRLKPNGYLLRRSPLADVIELEALRAAVQGRLACWQVLRALVVTDERVSVAELETLIERAEDQADRLYALHLQAVRERLVV
jgi:hypothetical protein